MLKATGTRPSLKLYIAICFLCFGGYLNWTESLSRYEGIEKKRSERLLMYFGVKDRRRARVSMNVSVFTILNYLTDEKMDSLEVE